MNTAARKQLVLGSIVELYIRTGEPVGSKAVSAHLHDICSSATIRNDMSEWIDRGYLLQPHTSAGRVPSSLGFRYYIDHLMPAYELPAASKQRLSLALPKFRGDPDRFLTDTVKAVARLTRCTAMITSPVEPKATLKRLELLQVGGSAVLVALLTSSGLMKSKVCHLDAPIASEDLERLSLVLNERFAGLPLTSLTPAVTQQLAVSFGPYAFRYAPLPDCAPHRTPPAAPCI